MEPCKSIDLNFLQIYTGVGSAQQHENQHFMLDALPWVNIFKESELLHVICLFSLKYVNIQNFSSVERKFPSNPK